MQMGGCLMGMNQVPEVRRLEGGIAAWGWHFDSFQVKVLVPPPQPLADLVNFGFKAPYLLVFEDKEQTEEEALRYAREEGLLALAQEYSGSVVFVRPNGEGGWSQAPDTLYADIIAESRIQQYYRDGIIFSRERFTREWGDRFIRGAIFRVCLYGSGEAADYIAEHCLKTLHGLYLWGPGEITPLAVTLAGLSVIPQPERRDILTVSVGNSPEVNAALQAGCDHLRIREKADHQRDYETFFGHYKRWCGTLKEEPDFEALGMAEEAGCVTVATSRDNRGDDAGTETHRIGYIAYYRRNLFDHGPVPLVLAFHGGGDSALHIAHVSGWWRVAYRHDFLLVAVENHLNSTASETIALIEHLRQKYPIDSRRIYASGFSMGGCKCWDLYQEYPQVFAALAPMCATFEVGLNVYGQIAPVPINRNVPVPLFYVGGEQSPLPELPFQGEKCVDRVRYVFEVNRLKAQYKAQYAERDTWEERVWGVRGDRMESFYDESRHDTLTVHFFESEDGVTRTAFASVRGQAHECREHSCEQAWQFMSRFIR